MKGGVFFRMPTVILFLIASVFLKNEQVLALQLQSKIGLSGRNLRPRYKALSDKPLSSLQQNHRTFSKTSLDLGNIANAVAVVPEDLKTSVGLMALTFAFLKFFTSAKGLTPQLSRKLIHTFSGPVLTLFWPLFSTAPNAKYYAALIPLLQIMRLAFASQSSDSALVKAVSRSGKKQEALGGPLIYMCVVLVATLVSFRNSPVALVAISQMAVGDGLSDIIGRRWGTVKWPFSKNKSIAGSAAFVLGAFGATLWSLYFTYSMGFTGVLGARAAEGFTGDLLLRVLGISIACGAVEVLPPTVVDDNISVPVTAAVLAKLILG